MKLLRRAEVAVEDAKRTISASIILAVAAFVISIISLIAVATVAK